MRYRAFISYSHSDTKTVAAMHRWLEAYRLPGAMRMRDGTRRLAPIFRDRDELPTSADLGSHLSSALEASETLLVFCSPASAASRWVNEEAATFIRLGREDRIVAVMIDGDAQGGAGQSQADGGHLPPALGALAERSQNVGGVVRVDLRTGLAKRVIERLQLVAAVAGVDAGALEREHLRRSIRRAVVGGVAALVLTAGLAGLAGWAVRTAAEARVETARAAEARDESFAAAEAARRAEVVALAEERAANESTDFFVSMFVAPNAPPLAANVVFADLLESACRRLMPEGERAHVIEDARSRVVLLSGFSFALAHLGRVRAAADAAAAVSASNHLLGSSDGTDPRDVMFVAAQTAFNASGFAKALEYCRKAEEMTRSDHGPSSRMTETVDVRLLSLTAQCLLQTGGETEEIQQLLQRARDSVATMDSNTLPLVVSLLRVDSVVQADRLQAPAVANRRLQEALAICAGASYPGNGRDWPAVALNIVELGHEPPPVLVSLADEAQRRLEDLLGAHHGTTLHAKVRLATALKKDGKLFEAIKILQPLMPSLLDRKNEEFEEYSLAAVTLADSLIALGRVAEATPLVDGLILDREFRRDTHTIKFAETLESKTQILRKSGKCAESLDAANRALVIREEMFGPRSVRLWNPLILIATCHGEAGQRGPQVATLERLLAILEDNGLETSGEAVQVHSALATVYDGDAEQRHLHAFRAVEVCEQAGVEGHLLADAMAVKGMCVCYSDKRLVEGLPILESAVRVATAAIGANDPRIEPIVKSLVSAAVAAGTDALLVEEMGADEPPEPLFTAATSAFEVLDSVEPLGRTAAQEARVVLAEQAAESAESLLSDKPALAVSLSGRGLAWLGPPATADSPRARMARIRLALVHAQGDLLAGRSAALSTRLSKDREAGGLAKELLLTMAIASVLEDDESSAKRLLVDCELDGRDPWPAWVAQSLAPASADASIAAAIRRLEQLARGE